MADADRNRGFVDWGFLQLAPLVDFLVDRGQALERVTHTAAHDLEVHVVFARTDQVLLESIVEYLLNPWVPPHLGAYSSPDRAHPTPKGVGRLQLVCGRKGMHQSSSQRVFGILTVHAYAEHLPINAVLMLVHEPFEVFGLHYVPFWQTRLQSGSETSLNGHV